MFKSDLQSFTFVQGDPNVQTVDLLTPLHIACSYGKLNTVSLLLVSN